MGVRTTIRTGQNDNLRVLNPLANGRRMSPILKNLTGGRQYTILLLGNHRLFGIVTPDWAFVCGLVFRLGTLG